jgi:hypothetical protein
MAACSAASKIPMKILRQAKENGCPAFTSSGRVVLVELLEWLFSPSNRPNDDGVDWSRELTRWRAENERVENERLTGELVEVEAVFRTFQGVFISMRQTILGSELSDREKDELLNNLRALSYDEAKRNGIADTDGATDGEDAPS